MFTFSKIALLHYNEFKIKRGERKKRKKKEEKYKEFVQELRSLHSHIIKNARLAPGI
jgi:hypothetical protein